MKRMYSLIAIIIAFLCFAFFRENNGFVTKQRIPKVGVLTLMHHPALDEIYKGYVDELANTKIVVDHKFRSINDYRINMTGKKIAPSIPTLNKRFGTTDPELWRMIQINGDLPIK